MLFKYDVDEFVRFMSEKWLSWAKENIPECDLSGARDVESAVEKILRAREIKE